jgi:hypothetical protein
MGDVNRIGDNSTSRNIAGVFVVVAIDIKNDRDEDRDRQMDIIE